LQVIFEIQRFLIVELAGSQSNVKFYPTIEVYITHIIDFMKFVYKLFYF
jgi:hypothetical protein